MNMDMDIIENVSEAIVFTAGYFKNKRGSSVNGTQLSTTPSSAYSLVSTLLKYGTVDPTILDLGSGSGTIVATAACMSIPCYGIENDEFQVCQCKQTLARLRLNATVLHDDLFFMNSLKIPATHVCMMNVGYPPALQFNVLRLLLSAKESIQILAFMKGFRNRESVFWELLSTTSMQTCLMEKVSITCGTEKHTMEVYCTDMFFWKEVEEYVTKCMRPGPIESFGDKAFAKWKDHDKDCDPTTPKKRKRSPPRQHVLTNMTPKQQVQWERAKRLKISVP